MADPTGDPGVSRALDLLRSARMLTAGLSLVRPLAETLQAVVEGVARIGFDGAVMNLVREDGDLEVVATAGPEGLCATLQGVVEPRDSWDRLLSAGEQWGSLVFVPAAIGAAVADAVGMQAWHAQGGDRVGEDAWQVGDDLFAPMTDREGELIGVLSVGDPHDLRLPGPMQRELFEMYAAHAAVAVENARLREAAERAAARLERERAHFQQAFELAPSGMAMFRLGDRVGESLRVNAALCRMLGRSREELLSGRLLDHVHPQDRAAAQRDAYSPLQNASRRYLHADGSVIWVSVSAANLETEDPEATYRLMHLVDITVNKRREEVLQHDALHDPLTGLANRRGLEAALAAAPTDCPLAVFFCDLDGFKAVNDAHGHDVGDLVLIEAARRLGGVVRSGDTLARLGGDEFVVLTAGLDELAVAAVAHRLAEVLTPPMLGFHDERFPGHRDLPAVQVGVSVGYATGGPGCDPTALLGEADRRMLLRKRRSQAQARGLPNAR